LSRLLLAAALTLTAASASAATRTYQADDSDFPNPERGFSRANGTPAQARAEKMSLMHLYVRLDDWKAAPLPDELLAKVRRSFADARAGGVKLVPRFIYNFPRGLPLAPGDEDAPLPRVLAHIQQLRPLLQENADVIAFLEAGFIGAWGEWHHSTSGLETVAARKAILDKLLDALPASRAVALRYQRDKIAIFGRTAPLTPAEAFSGSAISRVGHHNDCFLASRDDWDTYKLDGPRSLAEQKAYLAAENRYVAQGGETCNDKEDAQPYIQCPNALAELKALRWSQLNAGYHQGVLGLWRSQGCYGEIARRLGYRFRLTGARLPSSLRRGQRIGGTIRLVNDGFASPYNARGLELVLRNRATGAEHVVNLADDPRRWGAGEAHTIRIDAALPASLPMGTYTIFLNLPDPAASLRGRPEYSIRLANRGVWEPRTGYNALGLSLRVR
jgi:hypothetical protein